MISKLADEIYSKSIHFKKYDERNLLSKKNRMLLEKEIFETEELIGTLILQLRDNPNYSKDYFELSLFMYKTLAECNVFLTTKTKNYRETVKRYIWGFHNLPRAFLSLENTMKISPNEAMEYYKPYLKMD